MWALRRSAESIRRSTHCNASSRACFTVLDASIWNPDNEHKCNGGELRRSASIRTSLCGSSFVSNLFLGCRNLSSQAGRKSSRIEDELEDGFSDLEVPPEEIIREEDDAVKIADVEESDFSDNETEERDGPSHNLSDFETDKKLEKGSRKSFTSPLFQIILETPRQSIHSVLDKWAEEDNALGRSEISVAMLQLRKRRLFPKALQLVEWLEEKKLFDLVERDYASHLDLVAKVHGLQRAEKYINKIPKPMQTEVIYRTLLANCVLNGNVKKAEELFNKMKDLGFEVTTFACNQLLLLYKRVDRKKIADVLLLMEKENIKPSLFTYKLLIDTKGRSNDIHGMEQILETMKSEGIDSDLTIQAMVAKHYIFAGLNDKAETILKEMEGDDIKSNRNACKSLLPLYAALGKPDDVGRIWEICKDNLRLDECLAAIEAWGKLGQVEDAEKVFENLLKTWRKPSSKYYNALLKVYANHKMLSKGKELAKRMAENGCRIGPMTWDALVKLYVQAGEVEKADSILNKATQQNQIRPLYSSYMSVLDQYSKRGDIHNAEKIFHRLKISGYSGRMMQYRALLQAYINAKAPAYGFRERMKADNIFPNKALAAQLVTADAFRKSQISDLLD